MSQQDKRNSYIQLEYDKIKKIIILECQSDLGKQLAQKLQPYKDKQEIEYKLSLTSQLQELLRNRIHFDFSRLSDIQLLLQELKHQTYSFEEFQKIYFNISITNNIDCSAEMEDDFPDFAQIVHRIHPLPELEERFNQIFDADGEVKDSASKQLHSIRSRKRKLRKTIVSTLNGKLDDYSGKNYLHDKILTQRDGRFVIPVKDNFTTFVPGIVHGRSSSRSSVYVEPQEVVGLNNEADLLRSEEKQEIFRIFSEYTSQIRAYKTEIIENTKIQQKLDFFFAVARFSNRIQAEIPKITEKPNLNLLEARHPLLLETIKNQNDVIPFNLELGKEFNLLIISGPNTGGKTVTLKSVGLLALMALSGLPIPAQKDSVIGMFSRIFADIGDNQSLENALSTFSSHIKNIDLMVKNGDNASLVLIDEIGAATDPEQGSALAQAILEKLAAINCLGVITTHYTALKVFAEQNENCCNAAMQFDSLNHIPTYKFKLGLPGNSFAIEVASRLGMESALVERAKQLAGSQNVEMTDLLMKISEEKKELGRQNYQYKLKSALLARKIDEHQQKIDQLENDTKNIKRQSVKEAREFLTNLQRELNEEISNLKKSDKKNRKEMMEKTLRKVTNQNREFGEMASEFQDYEREQVSDPQTGNTVWLKDLEVEAEIVDITGDSIKVDMGGIFLTTSKDNLLQTKKKIIKTKSKKIKVPKAEIKLELKILGNTFDEALPKIDSFIDNAVMNGLEKIRIVHGKGTGALRSKVRQYLKSNSKVSDFFSPPPEVGGDGVTVVKLEN
jgi:DNA mismatch repair protein MutS2